VIEYVIILHGLAQ